MASSLLHNCKYSASGVLFFFSNVFQLEEALLCGLSLIYQVLLGITCHFKLKKAYGLAIHPQNFRKKRNCQRVCYITHYQGFMTAVQSLFICWTHVHVLTEKKASWHKYIWFTIPAVCLSFTKQKLTKKNLVSQTEKRNKLAQASLNSTVHHDASTFGTEALMSNNINSLTSLKSETQVVQDWLKW